MNKSIKAIIKVNFTLPRSTILVPLILLAAGILDVILDYYLNSPGNTGVSLGNYLYTAIIFAPIFIAGHNYKRIMHLGGKKYDFFWGSLLNYIILAAAVSAINLICYTSVDTLFQARLEILNLIEVFGWTNNGLVAAYFQQFAFLLWIAVFVHTLVMLQEFRIGWIIDVALIAILCVFIPIMPLRSVLVWFFYLTIYYPAAYVQIAACIGLSAIVYSLNLAILKKKKI